MDNNQEERKNPPKPPLDFEEALKRKRAWRPDPVKKPEQPKEPPKPPKPA